MSIIDIGICYQAEVILNGKRKPTTVNVLTSTPVEIDDIEGIPELIGLNMSSKLRLTEYRNVNGVPYQPLSSVNKVTKLEENGKTDIYVVPEHIEKEKSRENILDDIKEKFKEHFPDRILCEPEQNYTKYGRLRGLSVADVNSDLILTGDSMPEKNIPTVLEDDIKHIISDNSTLKINRIEKHIHDNMCIINGELYCKTRGPVFYDGQYPGDSRILPRPTQDNTTFGILDISDTCHNRMNNQFSLKVMTIDMYVDRLESQGRLFELDTNDVLIYDMEPFRNINKDAPGRIMFNHVFHDMIWIHLNKVINRQDSTYNEDAVNIYMNQLFEKYKDTFGTQLKHLYNDAINSGYDFDKVLTLINYTGSIIEDLSDKKNRSPKGYGYQKIYDSDKIIFNQNYVYNFYPEIKEIIDVTQKKYNTSSHTM